MAWANRVLRVPVRRTITRWGAAAAVVCALTWPLVAPPGVTGGATPAQAAACTGTRGVSVVVDFTAFDRPVRTGCASGDPSTAADALTQAGFTTVRVARFPGFLCRIDGLPSAEDDACVVTPPSSAYWAFWTAERGGSWRYAQLGIDAYRPPPGSVIGFAFGAGARPAQPPPAAPAPASSGGASAQATTAPNGTTADSGTTQDAAAPSAPAPPVTTNSAAAGAGNPPAADPPAAHSPADPSAPEAASDTSSTSPDTTSPSAGVGSTGDDSKQAGEASTSTRPPPSPSTQTARQGGTAASAAESTSLTGALVGLAVIAAVGAAAAWRARRRRRGQQP